MNLELETLAHKHASLCRVFGNTRRVLIVWALGEKELPVSAIAEAVDSSLQNTSQHLRLMKDKGILLSRRDGQTIYYRIAENEFLESCPILLKAQHITRN